MCVSYSGNIFPRRILNEHGLVRYHSRVKSRVYAIVTSTGTIFYETYLISSLLVVNYYITGI